jgi:hypothetical protein
MKKIVTAIALILAAFLSIAFIQSHHNAVVTQYNAGSSVPTISKITVHANVKIMTTLEGNAIRLRVRTEGANAGNGSYQTLNTTYTEITEDFTTNPDDSEAWEETDLDGLQIGASIGDLDNEPRVTQIWLVVHWSDTSTDTYRPNADHTDGSWDEQDSGTDLYQGIDEVTSDDDTTYIRNSTPTDWDYFWVEIEDPT